MFAAVDPTRPWPVTGLTTATWRHIRPRPVPLHDLVATQRGVYLAPLLGEEASSHCGDPFIHVVVWNDIPYVEDGHHRAMRAWLRGQQRQINARVLDMGRQR